MIQILTQYIYNVLFTGEPKFMSQHLLQLNSSLNGLRNYDRRVYDWLAEMRGTSQSFLTILAFQFGRRI